MDEKKSKKRFFLILGAEVFIVVLIGLFFFMDFDMFSNDDVKFVDPSSPCDLRKEVCKVKLSDTQSVTLEVLPKGIPLMKPLSFVVHANEIKADSIGVKIYATNMDMGIHKLTLRRVFKDRFEAKQILPSCIVGGMIWNADLTSGSFAEKKGVRFTFKTEK